MVKVGASFGWLAWNAFVEVGQRTSAPFAFGNNGRRFLEKIRRFASEAGFKCEARVTGVTFVTYSTFGKIRHQFHTVL